jgi:hypothetical protein
MMNLLRIAVILAASVASANGAELGGHYKSDRPTTIPPYRSLPNEDFLKPNTPIEVAPGGMGGGSGGEIKERCTPYWECDNDCRKASGYNFCPDYCKHLAC